jgi:hypothetical protein
MEMRLGPNLSSQITTAVVPEIGIVLPWIKINHMEKRKKAAMVRNQDRLHLHLKSSLDLMENSSPLLMDEGGEILESNPSDK